MKTIIAVGKVNILPLIGSELVPQCSVICAREITALKAEQAVLVVGKDSSLPYELSAFAAIVDCDNSFDPRRLKGVPVITCGMGSRNTVSVTSKTTERITLSLNRSIHTLRGICEPLELPLPLYRELEDYDYMAAFAASLLLGNIG